jgi:hypothetical protein
MELKNGLCSTVAIAQRLDRVRQGEEVIISQSGQALAKPPETGIAHISFMQRALWI